LESLLSLSSKSLLETPIIRAALKQAWDASNPGVTGGHEEGGFIVQDVANNLSIVRWPKGLQNSIFIPPHGGCKFDGQDIVASFHTHPNTGSDFLQEPGETDKRAVRDDPGLKGALYVGEFVISQRIIYLITPIGQVREMDRTQAVFAE
jgi:hypothetical protein